ncbi:hypothetical protein A2115_00165 [Candidatus Woesebacteria bacterium GWA1_41_8]|uniref:Peptidase C39-like domain-containing protein n=1 Tax=Candidatus Woesebacteria bacterium GWA1_41_8 TaxID=1802471 RepID=A0A1F7WG97_9BACT|nr:MAG: hypothetical protein A2115_00165 [Candidatus Woesebacteria bacterium GWA1_41_8]
MERMDISKKVHETIGKKISKLRARLARPHLANLESSEYFVEQVPPYISQLAGAEHSKIAGFYGFINDKAAASKFGAGNLEDFSYWAWRSCGIVGVQMIFKALMGRSFSKNTMELIGEGLNLNGYDVDRDIGWYHKSLVRLAARYGVEGFTHKFIPLEEVALLVRGGSHVLASIKSETGGHLLLIYGFRLGKDGQLQGFWLHDPNDFEKKGSARLVKKEDLERLFTRRAISFKKGGKSA